MASIKDNTLTSVKEGSIVNFKAIAQTPLKSLRVNFTPIQQGEGDPSPENIRAIKGWTGVNVYINGENLIPKTKPIQFYRTYPQASTGKFISSGVAYSTFIIPVPKGEIYLKRTTTQLISYAALCDEEPNINALAYSTVTMSSRLSYSFDNSEGHKYLAITASRNQETDWESFLETEPRVTIGDYKDYTEPIDGSIYPITFPTSVGTVYGGYVDIVKGKIVAKYISILADGVNIKANSEYEKNGWYGAGIVYIKPNGKAGKFTWPERKVTNVFCDTLPFYSTDAQMTTECLLVPAAGVLYSVFYIAKVEDHPELEDKTARIAYVNNWLQEHPTQIVYELETPIQYDITPQEIKTLIGTNSIYSNADSVSVEYYNLESLNLYKQRFKVNQPYLQITSGSVASFQTALKAPLKECKVYFQPVQEGEGDPSPDNIRPISGWDELDIWKTGRNVIHKVGYSAQNNSKPTDARYISNNYGTTISTINPDESVTITQQAWPYADLPYSYRNGYFIIIDDNLQFGKKYNVSFRITNITNNPLNASLSNISVQSPVGPSGTKTINGDKIIVSDFRYLNYSYGPTRHGIEIRNCGMSFTISDIIVTEVNDSTSPYEPYNGSNTSITLPDTYYGGYVDPARGKIIAEWGGMRKKLSEASYQHYNTGIARYSFNNCIPYGQIINTNRQMCNVAEYSWNLEDKLTNHFYGYYTTTDGVRNRLLLFLLDDHGLSDDTYVEFVAPFTTPVEFDIDPITIKTLKGINNIWSNTNGNIQTKYWTYGSV